MQVSSGAISQKRLLDKMMAGGDIHEIQRLSETQTGHCTILVAID